MNRKVYCLRVLYLTSRHISELRLLQVWWQNFLPQNQIISSADFSIRSRHMTRKTNKKCDKADFLLQFPWFQYTWYQKNCSYRNFEPLWWSWQLTSKMISEWRTWSSKRVVECLLVKLYTSVIVTMCFYNTFHSIRQRVLLLRKSNLLTVVCVYHVNCKKQQVDRDSNDEDGNTVCRVKTWGLQA